MENTHHTHTQLRVTFTLPPLSLHKHMNTERIEEKVAGASNASPQGVKNTAVVLKWQQLLKFTFACLPQMDMRTREGGSGGSDERIFGCPPTWVNIPLKEEDTQTGCQTLPVVKSTPNSYWSSKYIILEKY